MNHYMYKDCLTYPWAKGASLHVSQEVRNFRIDVCKEIVKHLRIHQAQSVDLKITLWTFTKIVQTVLELKGTVA